MSHIKIQPKKMFNKEDNKLCSFFRVEDVGVVFSMIKFHTVAILSIIWFFSLYNLLGLLNLIWRGKQTLLTGVLVLFKKMFNYYQESEIKKVKLNTKSIFKTVTEQHTYPIMYFPFPPALLITFFTQHYHLAALLERQLVWFNRIEVKFSNCYYATEWPFQSNI